MFAAAAGARSAMISKSLLLNRVVAGAGLFRSPQTHGLVRSFVRATQVQWMPIKTIDVSRSSFACLEF
jgi:hypothetical protein